MTVLSNYNIALPFVQPVASGNVFANSQFVPVVGANLTNPNSISGQTFTDTIIDVTGSSTISYSIGNLNLAATTSITFTYPSPANISGIIKTSTIYYSTENGASTIYVMYAVTDAYGRSQCNPAGATVYLTVGSVSGACTVFSSSTAPFGTCSLTMPSSSFQCSSTVLAATLNLYVNSVAVQNSTIGSVTLAPVPNHLSPCASPVPTTVGLYFAMPVYVAVPGDAITVQMYSLLQHFLSNFISSMN